MWVRFRLNFRKEETTNRVAVSGSSGRCYATLLFHEGTNIPLMSVLMNRANVSVYLKRNTLTHTHGSMLSWLRVGYDIWTHVCVCVFSHKQPTVCTFCHMPLFCVVMAQPLPPKAPETGQHWPLTPSTAGPRGALGDRRPKERARERDRGRERDLDPL